jgi:hypothetical protein
MTDPNLTIEQVVSFIQDKSSLPSTTFAPVEDLLAVIHQLCDPYYDFEDGFMITYRNTIDDKDNKSYRIWIIRGSGGRG